MSEHQMLDLDKAIVVIAILALITGSILFLLMLLISRMLGYC